MITQDDIKKMKAVFVTKEYLKESLKEYPTRKEMSIGFAEVIKFIGETRDEIVGLMSKQLEELKDITRRHQMTLENHDSRISHLEYVNKL